MNLPMLFSFVHNTYCSLQYLLPPLLLEAAMTMRIVNGTLIINVILISSLWHTAPDHGILSSVFCPMFRTGVS